MLNFEIDPLVLQPYVPKGCVLDTWQDRCFVSMVGFLFLKTRVLGVPIPFHRDFEEVNLRFYVRREEAGELRRGVVFIKEIVPKKAIAFVARTLYGEKYVAMPMRHQIEPADQPRSIHYGWRRSGSKQGPWEGLTVSIEGEPVLPPDESEETFITEHYWGYSSLKSGGTVEYQVEHPQWRVWRATEASLELDTAALYGATFAGALAAEPSSVFVAEGSPVVVRSGRRLPAK